MRNLFLRFLFLTTLLPCSAYADFTLPLESGWTFERGTILAPNYPATVPGTIHTDLFTNKLIEDPFIGTNESKLQWIDSVTWIYEVNFECSRTMRREKHIELQFDGLDTYCSVYLNGEYLFTGEDMFLSYKIDVKSLIKANNKLVVRFEPASKLIERNKALSSIKKYPGGDRVFIRKAQYQFGWDWGPRFVTCGIWKPVRIVGWSEMRITDVVYKTDFIDKDTAFVTVDFTFEADKAGKYQFLVFQNDSGIYSDFYSVKKNKPQHLKITFRVAHPKLWWCNGMGEQNLYKFTVATFRRRKVVAVATVTGIRKIELTTDMLNSNGSFAFVLNDKLVYAMGSNWIPSDNFLPRVLNSKVSAQLTDMRDLNMNMVRVWGGGIYESDHFYSQCDSLGLMVWQDLPFACSMYPYQTLDKDNLLTKEVTQNVRRIASHPSIALWCGDNENKEGWFNWGWQREFGYSKEDSAKIYNDYFNYSLKFMGCVAQHDPFFPYVMSSPQNGWGREVAYTQGDVHYWGVWWGNEPFSSYEDHTGRFVSEFGFQSAPSIHTFKEMGANIKFWFQDSTINAHQKHPTGFQTISEYMKRDYGLTPNSFEQYVYLTQSMQKDALSTAIEAQRRNFPTCMGSLFWQYNDCWPATSWSVQDYYGRKKLAWYELARLYQPLLVSLEQTEDSVYVWVVNNSSASYTGTLLVNWRNFKGMSQLEFKQDIAVNENSSVRYGAMKKTAMLVSLRAEDGFLTASFVATNSATPIAPVYDHTSIGKEIDHNYPDVQPKYSFVRYIKEGPMAITLSSNDYIRNVMIVCDDPNTTFSSNGFDLLPGMSVKVEITTTKTESELKESLRFISMNTLVNQDKLEKQTELED